jgi:DNA-binding response OmpR family regulator
MGAIINHNKNNPMEKKKVLIVEDESSLRNALYDKLTKEGFLALQAENGQKGLEVALEKHPDVILLDIVMPVMDGITMLGELRNDAWGKNAKVIVLTNLSGSERVAEAIALGAEDYLVKSDWKLEAIAGKIRQVLAG